MVVRSTLVIPGIGANPNLDSVLIPAFTLYVPHVLFQILDILEPSYVPLGFNMGLLADNSEIPPNRI